MAAIEPKKGDLAWICDRKAGFRIVKLESEPTEKTLSVQVIDPAKPNNDVRKYCLIFNFTGTQLLPNRQDQILNLKTTLKFCSYRNMLNNS